VGKTITEKILSRASGSDAKADDMVWAKVDTLMTHDPTTPGVVGTFRKHFGAQAKVWDAERHVMIPDHFVFTTNPQANANVQFMREFAREQGHTYFYDVGTPAYKGVCHIALAEGGHDRPGEVLVGTDSHTTSAGAFGTFAIGVGNTDAAFVLGTGEIFLRVPQTIRVEFRGRKPAYLQAKDLILRVIADLTMDGATYMAMEFGGEALAQLSLEERMTLCNMVAECGAKNGVMVPDEETLDYVRRRTDKPFEVVEPDAGAVYARTLVYDLDAMVPQVAKPYSPDKVDLIGDVRGVTIGRAYIGSCTGGKLEDFRAAATVLRGQRVAIETFAVPATREIYQNLFRERIEGESLHDILQGAGVFVSPEPGCAACCGGPADTFGRINEPMSVISTTNRNFPGRMGHKDAQVYLASPLTVAATAVRGTIADPREFVD